MTSAVADWASAEAAGIVFLPAAGSRLGSFVYTVGDSGNYWSSSADGSDIAYSVYFDSSEVSSDNNYLRFNGYSVRLITEYQ